MKTTRTIVGLVVLAAGLLAFQCLHDLEWGMKYYMLGQMFEKSDTEVPLVSRIACVFAPIGWWSMFSCLFFAIGAACRIRTPLRWPDLLALVSGAVFLWIAVAGIAIPFSMLIHCMGYPAELVIPPSQWVANIGLLLVSGVWMAQALRDLPEPAKAG